jgi:predicted  nucleic acid-binding Zn-ribbon protein
MESVRKSSELEQEMNRILSEISKSHGRQVELENELLQARLDYDESVFALETAKDQYDDAVHEGNLTRIALDDYEKAHPRADRTSVEYRQQKSRFETAAAKVRDAQYELERSRKKSDRLGKEVEDIRHKSSELDQKIIQLDDSLFEITEEYNEAIFFVDDETLYRSLKLEHHWKKFFSSLHFDKKLFEDVVKLFRTSELHALEFYVQELDAAADSEAFCHEKITGTDETECIARCQVAAGKYAVIRYKGKTIKSITIKDR